jgi:hypothetical protein
MTDVAAHFLEDALLQLRKYKALADGAGAGQDGDLSVRSTPNEQIGHHEAHFGNMRSRWRDFLTSTARSRSQTQRVRGRVCDTKERARALGGRLKLLFDALAPLTPGDLLREVRIRGESHTVLRPSAGS